MRRRRTPAKCVQMDYSLIKAVASVCVKHNGRSVLDKSLCAPTTLFGLVLHETRACVGDHVVTVQWVDQPSQPRVNTFCRELVALLAGNDAWRAHLAFDTVAYSGDSCAIFIGAPPACSAHANVSCSVLALAILTVGALLLMWYG